MNEDLSIFIRNFSHAVQSMAWRIKAAALAALLLLVCAGICRAQGPATVTTTATAATAAVTAKSDFGGGAQAAKDADFNPLDLATFQNFDIEKIKSLAQKNELLKIFIKGGPIMWPLLIASILALGTVIDRLFFLLLIRGRQNKKALRRFFEAVGKGDTEAAMRIGAQTKYYVVRTLSFALAHKDKSISSALLFAKEQEMKRFRRGIPILDTVITLAPLFGLLGTVTGMMGSFSLIGGELSAPGAITGGIAEALIATAFGLGIAITSLIPFNYLNNKMEEAQAEIDTASIQLEILMHARHPATVAGEMPHLAAPAKTRTKVHTRIHVPRRPNPDVLAHKLS